MRVLSALLLLLLVAVPCGAVDDDAYHYVQTTEIGFRDPVCLDSASDTLFGWFGGASENVAYHNGSSWTTVWSFADSAWCTGVSSLWVDDNAIYIGFKNGGDGGKLGRLARHPYSFTMPLTFDASAEGEDDGRFVLGNMCKSAAGSLYVGQYSASGSMADTAAYIYRSSTGEHWTKVYDGTERHVHGVWYDGYHDDLYAALGDGGERDKVILSDDAGDNWSEIFAGVKRARITDMAFLYDRRIAGVDRAVADDDTGFIWHTTDNTTFTSDLTVTDDDACSFFAMSANADSVIFAGSTSISTAPATLGLYRRNPYTEEWTRVLDLGDASNAYGIQCMTRFGSDGYAYFTDTQNNDLYKFRDAPVYTIGDTTAGADFSTIKYAKTQVAAGDTLILMAGTHYASDDLLNGVTLRGATRDNSLYIIKNSAANKSALLLQDAVVKDVTFTTDDPLDYGYFAMAEGNAAAGTASLIRCRWKDCAGAAFASLYMPTEITRVRVIDCEVDHSTNTNSGWMPFYITDVSDVRIDGLIVHECVTQRGVVRVSQTAAQDTTIIANSLFVDNHSQSYGGALSFVMHENSTLSQIRNCTFDGNECAAPTTGQAYLSNSASTIGLYKLVITGADSTYALNNGAADTIKYVDAWGNARNALKKAGQGTATFSDTTHIDPQYNSTASAATGYYQATVAPMLAGSGSEGYWGWEQYIPPAAATTVKPHRYGSAFDRRLRR